MTLEPVAVWELATAVRYTSSLDDRVFLSERLSDLGDKSREVKDHVIALNAQGYNSFHWVVCVPSLALLSSSQRSGADVETLAATSSPASRSSSRPPRPLRHRA